MSGERMPFHKAVIGEAFDDASALAVAEEHYELRCAFRPCRCTCRACLIRSLRYCEERHLTIPKDHPGACTPEEARR